MLLNIFRSPQLDKSPNEMRPDVCGLSRVWITVVRQTSQTTFSTASPAACLVLLRVRTNVRTYYLGSFFISRRGWIACLLGGCARGGQKLRLARAYSQCHRCPLPLVFIRRPWLAVSHHLGAAALRQSDAPLSFQRTDLYRAEIRILSDSNCCDDSVNTVVLL